MNDYTQGALLHLRHFLPKEQTNGSLHNMVVTGLSIDYVSPETTYV